MTPEAARAKLSALSIEVSDESIFKYIKAGDREVVELLLDAEVPPDVLDAKRTAAIVVASEAGQKDLARLLLARGASPEPLLSRPATKKDGWDKLTASSAVLSFISSLLIAVVGGIFTFTYNKRQIDISKTQADHDTLTKEQANKVIELEAVQKLIPTLAAKGEQEKAAALTLIDVLSHRELAVRFAALFPGEGSVQYLKQLGSSTGNGDKSVAVKALSTILTNGTDADSKLATNALSNVLNRPDNSNFKPAISINIAETADRKEADVATQALKGRGYSVSWVTVKPAGDSPHETTVRFFQYDRKTVTTGKELVQILKDVGFTVRTEYDAEFVDDTSRQPPAPGTFEFWIGTTPSFNPAR